MYYVNVQRKVKEIHYCYNYTYLRSIKEWWLQSGVQRSPMLSRVLESQVLSWRTSNLRHCDYMNDVFLWVPTGYGKSFSSPSVYSIIYITIISSILLIQYPDVVCWTLLGVCIVMSQVDTMEPSFSNSVIYVPCHKYRFCINLYTYLL